MNIFYTLSTQKKKCIKKLILLFSFHCRLFGSLPKYTQHLLVLLFGTFRVIASNAAHASTGMTSEALGVSVAPSFFQSCVSDGKTARMEDVLKFKVSVQWDWVMFGFNVVCTFPQLSGIYQDHAEYN